MTTAAYHQTKCKVFLVGEAKRLPSSSGFIEISPDVIQVSLSKSIKSMGTAALTLVPNQDYLNLIFPNDVIVVYFSRGITAETKEPAFVKTFFGFVDSVRRSISVDSKGATTTRISVQCSDFQKILENVALYTNMFITDSHKTIIQQLNNYLAGYQFFAQGMRMDGTPATIVNALLLNFLGFAGQAHLPQGYPLLDGDSRDITKKPDLLKYEVGLAVTDSSDSERDPTANPDVRTPLASGGDIKLVSQSNISDDQKAIQLKTKTLLDLIDRRYIEQKAVDGLTVSNPGLNVEGTLWSSMVNHSNEPFNELFCDLRLDPDWTGVDMEAGISTGGPIKYLGPTTDREGQSDFASFAPKLSKDEFGVSTVAGRYVPAIVLRESPFSYHLNGKYFIASRAVEDARLDLLAEKKEALGETTGLIQKLKAQKLNGTQARKKQEEDLKRLEAERKQLTEEVVQLTDNTASALSTVGQEFFSEIECRFAPVFFSGPDNQVEVGRVNPVLHADDGGFSNPDRTVRRFIHSSQITVADIISEDIGRSDADTVNLIETYNTRFGQNTDAHYYRPYTPLLHPESIRRFGLRIKETNSKFAMPGQPASAAIGFAKSVVQTVTRWNLLMDMWCLHNPEYLSGTFTLRGRPDIRVGYRLDITDRDECYYVETVNHEWTFTETLTTSVAVSRGQPLSEERQLLYVPPMNLEFSGNLLEELRKARGNRIPEIFEASGGFTATQSSAFVRRLKKSEEL